jgi:hypothetical protein
MRVRFAHSLALAALAALGACSSAHEDAATATSAGAAGGAGASGTDAAGSSGTSGNSGANAGGGSGASGANSGGAGAAGSGGNAGAAGSPACPGTRPDATNTGVPAGVTLTIVDHDVTLDQDDATLDASDVHGFVIVKANRVKITRSIVRGGVATQNGDGIEVVSGSGTLIEDSEVALANPSAYLDGIACSDCTVRRANIHGGVDGMKLGSNGTVECSYIHDLASFASDPNQGGGPTHNDTIQILSGSTIRVRNNALVAATDQNAAIQVTQDFGLVSDLVISGNYADGGGCTFNLSHKGGTSLTVTVSDNRFGRNSFYACPILESTQTTLSQSGNVWDDDGTPVPIQTHD